MSWWVRYTSELMCVYRFDIISMLCTRVSARTRNLDNLDIFSMDYREKVNSARESATQAPKPLRRHRSQLVGKAPKYWDSPRHRHRMWRPDAPSSMERSRKKTSIPRRNYTPQTSFIYLYIYSYIFITSYLVNICEFESTHNHSQCVNEPTWYEHPRWQFSCEDRFNL